MSWVAQSLNVLHMSVFYIGMGGYLTGNLPESGVALHGIAFPLPLARLWVREGNASSNATVAIANAVAAHPKISKDFSKTDIVSMDGPLSKDLPGSTNIYFKVI